MSTSIGRSDRTFALPAASAPGDRYNGTAQALHWVTAALMFVVIPLGWMMVSLPGQAASRGLLYTLHKSIGVTILALVAVRLGWRAAHPAPAPPGNLARWQRRAAGGGAGPRALRRGAGGDRGGGT